MKLRVLKLGGSLLNLPDLAARLHRWLHESPADINLIIVGGGPLIDAIRSLDELHQWDQEVVHWQCVGLLRHTAELVHQLIPEYPLLATAEELADWLQRTDRRRPTRIAEGGEGYVDLAGSGSGGGSRPRENHSHPPKFCANSATREAPHAFRATSEVSDLLANFATSETSSGTDHAGSTAVVQVQAFYHPGRKHPALTENWDTTTDSIAALLAADQAAEELVLLKSTLPAAGWKTSADWAAAGIVDACFPHIAAGLSQVTLVNFRQNQATAVTVNCRSS